MTALQIIDFFYADEADLRHLLLHHSLQVRDRALLVADCHPEFAVDRGLLERGALLHDIGIGLCDAPSIHCHGSRPYIEHGPLGARMLRELGDAELEPVARICERHTGTGLPGFEPETLEEQIVCYADKFYSKSHPERTRTPEQTAESLRRFGEHCAARFWEWHALFKVPSDSSLKGEDGIRGQ